jgi:hypothetical protein
VKLAAADQHEADLRQLTRSTGQAVRLDVDREVFGFRRGCRVQIQGRALYASPQTERTFAFSRAARPGG